MPVTALIREVSGDVRAADMVALVARLRDSKKRRLQQVAGDHSGSRAP